MDIDDQKFIAQVPKIDLSEGLEMLTDFSREAQRHLISARNSLLVLETVSSDKESIENIFKTFHTIKGLADFLELHDICFLTHESEKMLDMARKGQLEFNSSLVDLTTKVMDDLQTLLELLDEQLTADGTLKSDYLDVSKLVQSLQDVSSQKTPAAVPLKISGKSIPTINFEPDMSLCSQLESKLSRAKGELSVDKDFLRKLVEEFQQTSKGLKEAQSKLMERQRELIKERELAIKLTQQAQDEARAKSEYLANMSHEIRTLINAVMGFTELLRESELDDKQMEHVSTILLSGKMLLEIVNNILDFSKVESGKLKLEQIEFNLEHIISEVFKIIRTRLEGKPINLYFSIADNISHSLVGDPTRLKQIFINLLENAIKFTESGEIGLDVALDSGKRPLDGKYPLCFTVRDTGIGIPEDRLGAVFESFTQASDSTTRLYGGSGLGLALCKTFVESMNGKIWVESELGQGSRFCFVIDIPKGKQDNGSVDLETVTEFSGAEVMMVDGHEPAVKKLRSICRRLKMNVLPVMNDSKQASEQLLKFEDEKGCLPAIIFIDVLLPGKEGTMLAYKIRQHERYQGIKLVAISSDIKIANSPDFQQAGFDLVLVRPIIADEVLDAVQRLLGSKGPAKKIITDDMVSKMSCAGVKVLVVEDSIPNQELLKVHFESLECNCDYASNGQEALDKFKETDYDICFMDLQMPQMGGLEAAQHIRQDLKKEIPIIALTAAEAEDEREKCILAGMNDYLPKPFGVDELKQKIIKYAKI